MSLYEASQTIEKGSNICVFPNFIYIFIYLFNYLFYYSFLIIVVIRSTAVNNSFEGVWKRSSMDTRANLLKNLAAVVMLEPANYNANFTQHSQHSEVLIARKN